MTDILKVLLLFAACLAFALIIKVGLDYILVNIYEMLGITYYPTR